MSEILLEDSHRDKFVKRSSSRVSTLGIQALKNRLVRSPTSASAGNAFLQPEIVVRPKSRSISKKIRDVFKTDKESSPKSSPNLSPDSNPDPEAPDTNDPDRKPGKRRRRHASISERSLTFRYDHGFTHLKFADLNVHRSKYQLRASFLKFLRRYGVRIWVPKQQRTPHARKPARKLSLRPSAEWIGPMPAPKPAPSLDSKDDAKFEIVSKLNMESRVYPKEMYPVAPARKRKIDLRWGQARPPVRIRVFPDDVESGGPGWEQKIRDILMVDPTDETVSGAVQDPLYNSTTLTACTSTGQNHLTPPRSLPLTSLLRRSVDSAYSDGFTPISPGEDHRPNMIFTNKKSGSTDSPKTPFSRSSGIKGSRASTSSSSMSSVDIEPVSPMDPNATTIVPPPRKKERAVKKQNFGDSIKNFIKPTIDQRSQQFHKIFKGLVSTQETFVASYSCALQREILAQGRIYLSNVNIAFIANILGWETKQVIRFTDVVSIKRAKTAKIFANSIEIVTKDQTKHFFASFANREKSFVLMYRLWQMIASDVPPNGIICSDYKLLPPVYEMGRDQLDVDVGGANALELDRTTSMLFEPPTPSEPPTPDVSSIPDTEFPNPSLEDQDTASEADENEETNCTCNHEGKLYLDNVYEIPCEQLKSIMFGSTPWFYLYAAYMKNHSVHNKIINNIGPPSTFRCTPWQTLTTKENGRNVTKTTCVVTYTMTVNFSMTMRQIDVHEELELVKMFPKGNQGFKVIKETKNSGAPYTDCFVVNTSYCVTRISKTQSRLKVHGAMKFVKAAPWGPIKGYMEKSTDAGLAERYRALDYCLLEDIKNNMEASSSITAQIEPEPEVLSSEDESKLPDNRDRTLTSAMAKEGPPQPQKDEEPVLRREFSTFSTTTMVPNPQTGTALVSPDLEFYTKVIVILLASILFFQLFQWWSMPTPSCPYSEALVRLISQLKNPEIADLLRQKQSQEVQRSIGHLSEQLNELMSLMRVRDEL